MQQHIRKFGFTIIELLVVVTIIVVLLALLAPAMDKAIYQAELTVCGSNMSAIANGAITYAATYQRAYPYREGVYSPGWYPQYAVQQGQTNKQFNDRPALSQVMSLNKNLNDPFVQPIDIEGADDANWIWTSNNLWFGFKYTKDRGMLRLGDDVEFTPSKYQGQSTTTFKSRVIASDYDRQSPNFWSGSHPDREDKLASVRVVNSDPGAVNTVANQDLDFRSTLTRFQGGSGRGMIDMNFAYDDGAVIRHTDISLNAHIPDVDGRMAQMGNNTAANNFTTSWDFVPRQK